MKRRYRTRQPREKASRLFYVAISLGRPGSLLVQVRANSSHEAAAQGKSKAYAEVCPEARKDVHIVSIKEVTLCESFI